MALNDLDHLILPVSQRDHCYGSETAIITLVEYGDYQCFACGEAHPKIQAIQQYFGEQLRFVFRHFPQSSIHPEADHAAEAVEAAASQGKFWEMHTRLFENQSHLADSYLVECAIALFLDVDQFLQEMTSDRHVPKVQVDLTSGIESGVTQTPTFFINGVKYYGACEQQAFIDAILKRLGDLQP